MRNVYNTTDPQKLLELKRQEMDALLDVLRTINLESLEISQLCLISRNVLRAQLGVKKVTFYYEFEQSWKEGMRLGFEEMGIEGLEELIEFKKITKVTGGFAPYLFDMGIEYVIPITNRGEPKAYFVIADFADTEMEVQNDLIFIETLGNILNVAIQNRELIKERVRQEYLRKELEVAETIQKQLLISNFNRFKEMDVYGINLSHHRIGGDFYDVVKKGKGTTFVCIADVAGKGIAAALLMSNLQANLRALCAQYTEPDDIVVELNKIIFQITKGDKFVSLFLARIDIGYNTFSYVNAGHNYPVFLSKDGHKELDTGCVLLGVLPEVIAEKDKVAFQPGDCLFMYTDGVVEQVDEKEEMFGRKRIFKELKESHEGTSQEIITHFRNQLFVYSNNTEMGDDITMLNVKFKQ